MMMIVLKRYEMDGVQTFGRFYVNGVALCRSLERPWLDNKVMVSCIPAGKYKLRLSLSPRFGAPYFEVMDVPGRTRILIHPANRVHEINGCIATGQAVHIYDDGGKGLTSSRDSLKALIQAIANTGDLYGPWDFEIIEEY